MLTLRIIPCLDVIRNRVAKDVKFQNNIDFGAPVELAARISNLVLPVALVPVR